MSTLLDRLLHTDTYALPFEPLRLSDVGGVPLVACAAVRAAARRLRLLAVRSSSRPHSMCPCLKAISIGVQLFLATASGFALASSSRSTTRMWLFIAAWCSGVAFEALRMS